MALIPPRYLDAVVSINMRLPEVMKCQNCGTEHKLNCEKYEDMNCIATGFFYGDYTIDGKKYTFLVTNAHVVNAFYEAYGNKEDIEMSLQFNRKSGEGSDYFPYFIRMKGVDQIRIDQEADVAVGLVRLENLENHQYSVFDQNKEVADIKKLADIGVSEGDHVFIIGFPLGERFVQDSRFASTLKFAIVTHGTVSRISDIIKTKEAKPFFLIDCAALGGNSGGPVVLCPQEEYVEGTKAQKSPYLIGVLSAGALTTKKVEGRDGLLIITENTDITFVRPMDHVNALIKGFLNDGSNVEKADHTSSSLSDILALVKKRV